MMNILGRVFFQQFRDDGRRGDEDGERDLARDGCYRREAWDAVQGSVFRIDRIDLPLKAVQQVHQDNPGGLGRIRGCPDDSDSFGIKEGIEIRRSRHVPLGYNIQKICQDAGGVCPLIR